MDVGTLLHIVLLAFLTAVFGVEAAKGMRGQRLWLPPDGTDNTWDEIPRKYRKLAGLVFLVFAIASLAWVVLLVSRLLRGA